MAQALKLPSTLGKKLHTLAIKTGKTESYYLKQAVESFLEEMEDAFVAISRLKKPAKRYSAKQAEKLLGLAN